jgi:hypothetical protein
MKTVVFTKVSGNGYVTVVEIKPWPLLVLATVISRCMWKAVAGNKCINRCLFR